MIFTETRELPLADIQRFNGILDGTIKWPSTWPDRYETIEVLSVNFGDGWEIDINICFGEPTPYVDAVLFENGCEVYAWEIAEDIVGEWQVVLDGTINKAFRLEIAVEGTL